MASKSSRWCAVFSLAVILAVAPACSGGGSFVPDFGPYSGSFMVGQEVIGSLALTANGSTVSGTGTLTHNAQPVSVAIAATINGKGFSGFVSNASLGGGDFNGAFRGSTLTGTFSYTDAGGITRTEGTWTAIIEK